MPDPVPAGPDPEGALAPERTGRLHPGVEVRPSPVAGRGLFATTDLAAGTVVARVGGALVAAATLRRPAEDGEETVCTVQVDDDRHLLLTPDDPVRFLNHACDPNLGWAGTFALAARVDVRAGEELLVDYAMSIADESWILRCHCASYRCRQMVEGSDWRIPQLQQRYAGWWSPYVGRLVDAARTGSRGA